MRRAAGGQLFIRVGWKCSASVDDPGDHLKGIDSAAIRVGDNPLVEDTPLHCSAEFGASMLLSFFLLFLHVYARCH